MMKALLTEPDGGQVLVLGLTHYNVEMLKKDRPIVANLGDMEANLVGTIIITAVQPDGSFAAPETTGEAMLLAFSLEDLDHMVTTNKTALIEVETGPFCGKVLTFSGKNEHALSELFAERFKMDEAVVIGSTCATCGSARRDDGTCDCETFH